jgi:2'-5' RNA ligase
MQPIVELRRRYDPLAEQIDPHITLVFPFESPLPPQALRAHLVSAMCGVSAFPIRLAEITGHEAEYLFLNVKRGNDALIELHDRLYAGPLAEHRSMQHTYVPHVTVGRVSDPRVFRDALTEAGALMVQIDTRVAEVSIYDLEARRTVDSIALS